MVSCIHTHRESGAGAAAALLLLLLHSPDTYLRLVQGAINDNFAKFTEALFVAEQQARQAVEMRTNVQKELAAREKAKKDLELRNLAIRARMERTGAAAPGVHGHRQFRSCKMILPISP